MAFTDLIGSSAKFRALLEDVSEAFHPGQPGAHFQAGGSRTCISGPAPDPTSYQSYATFSDPDGNRWLLQEVTKRLPARREAPTTNFPSANDLASALGRRGRARTARDAEASRSELAGLVRRSHGGGAGR